MSRYIHFVSDELRLGGHVVDHLFTEDLNRDIPDRGKLRRFFVPVQVVRAVRRVLATKHYDVVEIHEPISLAYAFSRQFLGLPPLLVSVYALESRSHRARIRYSEHIGKPLDMISKMKPLSVVWQANIALKLADHVCVETTEDANHLRCRLGVPRTRYTIQHGGVSPELFMDRPRSIRSGILFVGTWIERKGILDLVAGLSSFLDLRPSERVTIAGCSFSSEKVLGDFPERHRNRITVIPKITDDKVLQDLYFNHSIFAFPSTFEGLPLVILEAAAAGLAIVTTAVCGMKDTIHDGINGLIVPVGDSARLAAALERLAANPDLVERLGRAASDSVRHYTWKRSADQFLQGCYAAIKHGAR
ncbi:MAG: glycosyltransferase family 4 protein [Fimbriiglobus sp.]